jgi:protein arginine N-methyltransferase 1
MNRIPLYLDDLTLHVAVEPGPADGDRPEIWPSLGEYPCYDPFLYSSMTRDSVRNREFERALARVAAGRFVIDIGTGQDLNWALTAAGLGARRVVAVEGIPESYEKARALLAGRPEASVVELEHAFSAQLRMNGRAEVCVAEVIGSIASAEGMLALVADARGRLLTDDAVVVPHRCTTEIAAIGLREIFPAGLGFTAEAVPYLGQVFELFGAPFDIRLGIANLAASAVLSTAGTVEDLPFNGVPRWSDASDVRLRMTKDGAVDGVLCWITLTAYPGAEVIDTIRQRTSWVPVYLPLFDDPVPVREDDTLDVHFGRTIGDDGVHPDYRLSATLHTAAGTTNGESLSRHHGGGAGGTAVHRELFGLEGAA